MQQHWQAELYALMAAELKLLLLIWTVPVALAHGMGTLCLQTGTRAAWQAPAPGDYPFKHSLVCDC
jgi:hypothetical protein